jgi:hypothetical protein
MNRCQTCEYAWPQLATADDVNKTGALLCRFYPPKAHVVMLGVNNQGAMQHSVITIWPTVNSNEFCSKHSFSVGTRLN